MSESTALEFVSPLSHRAFTAFKGFLVEILFAGSVAGLFWGVLVRLSWTQQAPAWIHVVGAIVVLGVIIGIYRLLQRGSPTRCRLSEHRVWLGGRLAGRSMNYDSITLLKLVRPEHSFGAGVQVVLVDHAGKQRMIWLSDFNACECLEALHTLCQHCPALGLSGEVFGPPDGQFASGAAVTIRKELARKSKVYLRTVVALAVAGFGGIAALVFGGQVAQRQPKIWICAIIGPIGAAGLFVTWLRQRRTAAADAAAADRGGESA